jgi:hypothetical protein
MFQDFLWRLLLLIEKKFALRLNSNEEQIIYRFSMSFKGALWKPGMPEYGGISRNMPEYHNIFRW